MLGIFKVPNAESGPPVVELMQRKKNPKKYIVKKDYLHQYSPW